MRQHEHFKFSVTIHCPDLFMISAMRGLAWQCQPEINRQISVSGASNAQWHRREGKATFYFTTRGNRIKFLAEASRLFKIGWEEIDQNDVKTAPPQS
jgi:hypothetical protein